MVVITENKQNINLGALVAYIFLRWSFFSWLRSFSPLVGGRGGEQMAEIAKISQMGRFPEVTRMEAAFLQDDFSIHSLIFILLPDSLLLSQCDLTSHWPLHLCKMSPMQHPELHPHQSMLTRQGCTVHTMQCTPCTLHTVHAVHL